MTSPSAPSMRGAAYALVAFGLFATHDVIVKFLGGTYSPFQVIFFTSLLSFPLTTIMLMHDQSQANLRPAHPWWVALRTLCTVVALACAFYAFSVLPLAQTYAIIFAMPLLITVLAVPILGESVGWRRAVAVMVGLCGVIVVLRPGSTELGPGHLAALGTAVFGALGSVIVRRIGRDERNVVLLLYPLLANFLIAAVLMPKYYQPMPFDHFAGLAAISVLGFVAGLCMIAAYKKSEAALVAPMQYSQMVWATVYGAVFFDEIIDAPTLVGAAVIIGSGLYILFRENKGGRSTNTPVLNTRARGHGASFRISPFLRRNGSD